MTELHPALTFNGMRAVQTQYGLTPHQFAAYMAITLSADGFTGKSKPLSYATIGDKAGMSRRHAYNCALRLKELGLVEIAGHLSDKSQSGGNIYMLLWNNESAAIASAPDVHHVQHPVEDSSTPVEPCSTSVEYDATPLLNTVQQGVEHGAPIKDIYTSIKDQEKTQEKEGDSARETAPARLLAFGRYETNFGLTLTKNDSDWLTMQVSEFGDSEVCIAIDIAHRRGKRSKSYILGILNGRVENGEVGQPADVVPKSRSLAAVVTQTKREIDALLATDSAWNPSAFDEPAPETPSGTVSVADSIFSEVRALLPDFARLLVSVKAAAWDGETLTLATPDERTASIFTGAQAYRINGALYDVLGHAAKIQFDITREAGAA